MGGCRKESKRLFNWLSNRAARARPSAPQATTASCCGGPANKPDVCFAAEGGRLAEGCGGGGAARAARPARTAATVSLPMILLVVSHYFVNRRTCTPGWARAAGTMRCCAALSCWHAGHILQPRSPLYLGLLLLLQLFASRAFENARAPRMYGEIAQCSSPELAACRWPGEATSPLASRHCSSAAPLYERL